MARLTETDLNPKSNWVQHNDIVHFHMDDGSAAGFVGHYDKVFLCMAYVESVDLQESQNYLFHIYTLDKDIDPRLSYALESFEHYLELNDIYKSGDVGLSYSYRAASEFSKACRIMEKYLAEKCKWKKKKMILDIKCKMISIEDEMELAKNNKKITSVFDKICD